MFSLWLFPKQHRTGLLPLRACGFNGIKYMGLCAQAMCIQLAIFCNALRISTGGSRPGYYQGVLKPPIHAVPWKKRFEGNVPKYTWMVWRYRNQRVYLSFLTLLSGFSSFCHHICSNSTMGNIHIFQRIEMSGFPPLFKSHWWSSFHFKASNNFKKCRFKEESTSGLKHPTSMDIKHFIIVFFTRTLIPISFLKKWSR